MTRLTYLRHPMNLWIETILNLNIKLQHGWLNLFHNDRQLFFTVISPNNIGRIENSIKKKLKCRSCSKKRLRCQPA